ncbi:MAG TPA: helix-turn-helix domain-containing protein [Acidimicrobiales bacterium]|nr:helix-turn-helix domain-containing protein [Acidimicrobiales bacterium]
MTQTGGIRSLRPSPVAGIAGRVLRRMDTVVERLGRAYCEEVAEYAALPPDELHHEVLPVSRRIVEGFFAPLAESREPDPAMVSEIATMGRRRLTMGIPLEPMLHVYRVAGRVVWDAVVEATEPAEAPALAELGRRWMDYIDRAASVAANSYLAASHERVRAIDARRRAMLDALLSVEDALGVDSVARRFTTTVAPSYTPVVIDGEHASAGIDSLLAVAPDGTVGGERNERTLLLVPGVIGDLDALFRAAHRPRLAWGPVAAPGAGLAASVTHAECVLAAAQTAGRDNGIFGPDDLLLDRLLLSDDRVASALERSVLAPLVGGDRDELLLSTLRSYLASGSVPETARREVVHPNTVLYRLRRVRELTGLDPRVPADATVLVLGLLRRSSA